jgi:predicted outer membrane repeat protein
MSSRTPSPRPHARTPRRSRSPQAALRLEELENRVVPAVFNVNTTFDIANPPPGIVSLRQAINDADAVGGTNTINLTVAGTYNLTQGELSILDNTSGGSLSIVNTSHGKVTVTANHASRVFDINPGDSSTPFTVSMTGFTITGGKAFDSANPDGPNGSGGGIRDQGNVGLSLTNMTVTGNQASADGGGIAMENTANATWTLSLSNTTVSNNHAGDAGGGVESDGTGTITIGPGSVISGNTSVNQGAGVWLDAIGSSGAKLTMTGTVVNDNSALSAGTVGGGIGNAGNGAVTIIGATISNNFSGGAGGGFADQNNLGSLTVLNSVFRNNTATGNGGAIAEGDALTLIRSSEIDNNFSGNNGGGVCATGGTLYVQSSTFANNIASNGGGLEVATTGSGLIGGSIITDSTFDGNTALSNNGGLGGGIQVGDNFSGDLLLQSDTLTANNALAGGGIEWEGPGHVAVENTIIAGNFANVGPDEASQMVFTASLNGANQVPPAPTTGTGSATLTLNALQNTIYVSESWNNLSTPPTAIHIHNAPAGQNGPVATDANGNLIEFTSFPPTTTGSTGLQSFSVNSSFVSQLLQGNIYTNIHTAAFPGGEIRGQFTTVTEGQFTDLGGNLIGVAEPDSGFTNPKTFAGTTANPINAQLGTLQYNGGPTVGAPGDAVKLKTVAPLSGSTAIGNGIVALAPAYDERGYPSVVNGAVNIGAVSAKPKHEAANVYQAYLASLGGA